MENMFIVRVQNSDELMSFLKYLENYTEYHWPSGDKPTEFTPMSLGEHLLICLYPSRFPHFQYGAHILQYRKCESFDEIEVVIKYKKRGVGDKCEVQYFNTASDFICSMGDFTLDVESENLENFLSGGDAT